MRAPQRWLLAALAAAGVVATDVGLPAHTQAAPERAGNGELGAAPVALADAYAAVQGVKLEVPAPGVLGNDSSDGAGPLVAVLLTPPQTHLFTLLQDGYFRYTSGSHFAGEDSFTYLVRDESTGLDSEPVTVTIDVNAPPAPSPDSYAIEAGKVLSVDAATGVLANDSDPNGDPITASLEAQPSHGSLTLGDDGSFSYQPDSGYIGPDSFSYRAGDGELDSEATAVTITVEPPNQAPRAAANSFRVREGQVLAVAAPGLLGNDRDPDGDRLSAARVSGPTHGALTLRANGSFTYRPARGFAGVDRFTYRASDGALASAPVTVRITVTPLPMCAGRKATIVGTKRADVLRGTPRADVIVALGGNDTINARGGNDVVCGGRGADTIRGRAGRDRLFGGPGRDRLFGGPGRDRLFGGPGRDVLNGGPGRDFSVSAAQAAFGGKR